MSTLAQAPMQLASAPAPSGILKRKYACGPSGSNPRSTHAPRKQSLPDLTILDNNPRVHLRALPHQPETRSPAVRRAHTQS